MRNNLTHRWGPKTDGARVSEEAAERSILQTRNEMTVEVEDTIQDEFDHAEMDQCERMNAALNSNRGLGRG